MNSCGPRVSFTVIVLNGATDQASDLIAMVNSFYLSKSPRTTLGQTCVAAR